MPRIAKHPKANKPTKLYKRFTAQLYPTPTQKNQIDRTIGCCLYVRNKAIIETKEAIKSHHDLKTKGDATTFPDTTGYTHANKLKQYREEVKGKEDGVKFLKDVSFNALQQTLINLGKTYARHWNCIRNKLPHTSGAYVGTPKVHKRNASGSYAHTEGNGFTLENGVLKIVLLGVVKVGWGHHSKRRPLPSHPKSITVMRDNVGRYSVSFVCEVEPVRTYGTWYIGIDVGVKDLIVTSDGLKINAPKYLKRYLDQIRKWSKALSRRIPGSKGYEEARIKLAKLHQKVANCRKDFAHKVTSMLIKNSKLIVREGLTIRNMMKNRKLSRALSDAGLGMIIRMLDQKANHTDDGCKVIPTDRFFPSTQTCHKTLQTLPKGQRLTLKDREWNCPFCHEVHDRDINAAKALLANNFMIRDKATA